MSTRPRAFLFPSTTWALILFFGLVIALGTLGLMVPGMWDGEGHLVLDEALFTAVSAVTVTGLTVVDTSYFSLAGQSLILLLIQIGGLGILTFASVYLASPRSRMSFSNRSIIGDYFLPNVDNDPRRIVRKVIIVTLVFELSGALILWALFAGAGIDRPLFNAVFHAISAFCNAGFSTSGLNAVQFQDQPWVLVVVTILLSAGGVGFLVYDDVRKRIQGRTKHLALHTKVVLGMYLGLTGLSTLIIALAEWNNPEFASMDLGTKLSNLLFQGAVPRTAGFNSVDIGQFGDLSIATIMVMMIIGGGPGSISGGIKVTTAFVVGLVVIRGLSDSQPLAMGKRNLAESSVRKALVVFVRASVVIVLGIVALVSAESMFGSGSIGYRNASFEVISAFSTVGLSLGVTPQLSLAGRFVIVGIMLVGRLGLLALSAPQNPRQRQGTARYPEEEVMLG